MTESYLIIHIRIIGVCFILLGLVHVIFPSYFNWKNELNKLSLINRQMMQFHTFFIALMIMLIGLLCLTSASELVGSKLGKILSIGFAVFWTCRLFVQFFGYSSALWKNKPFETVVHVFFSVLWVYVSTVFWLNGLG